MPRANRLLPINVDTAIDLFAKHHIVAVRRKRYGEISAVKHVQFGWMKPQEYYALQKFHEIPWGAIIEGAYRLKMAIFSVEIEILGTDIPIPVGAGLVGIISGKIALSIKDGNYTDALAWSAMLALPFGEIAAIWVLTQEALGIATGFTEIFKLIPGRQLPGIVD